MKKEASLLVVGALLAGSIVSAWAHSGNVLNLESLEQYVALQDTNSVGGDPKIHKLWKSLDKALAKDAKHKLGVDLGKLAALSVASNGKLVADGQLRALLDAALDQADLKLRDQPDEVATFVGQLKKDAQKQKVLAMVATARNLHTAGKTAGDGGDEKSQLKDWKLANSKFVAAIAQAKTFIRRQGGALPQFKTAVAGRVYTVVGQGEGGFNGDDKEARRSQLYFVEECRFGPDGLLYILDWNNHRVRRRTDKGRIEHVCGSGIPGDSEGLPFATDLNHPSSLVFDEPTTPGTLGKIYLAAWHNHKVKVYDPTGGPDPRYTGHGPRVYTISGTVQGGGIVNNVDTSGDGSVATLAKYNLMPGILRMTHDTATGSVGDLLTIDAANETVRRIDLSHGVIAPNLVQTQVFTGTITRVAGTIGQTGITGDDGPASACTMNFSKSQNAEPDGRMELTPDGTKVYIICGQGNCVRVMDLNTGVITRFAGTGVGGYSGDGAAAKDAKLNRPADVAVGADGTVFISDSYNNVIRKVDTLGVITTYAGPADASAGTAGDDIPVASAKFNHPAGLELDANGNLYVCDRQNNVIRVITSANPGASIVLPVAPFEIPTTGKGAPPARPATGATGTIATYAGSGNFGFNTTDELNPRLALDTDLYWPQDVSVDPNLGLVYIVDWNNHRIRRIEANGVVHTVVGSGLLGDAGGEGPDAKLNHPTDIAFHPITGDLWIAAWHTDKIIRLDQNSGRIIYMAGNKRAFSGDGAAASVPTTGFDQDPVTTPFPAAMSQMNIPVSVKFTANGDWYVSDEGNQRIRKVSGTSDVITTIAGDGTQDFGGDNGPAALAKFNFPVGQAAQPAAHLCISQDEHWLFIADTNNNRVRRIDLTDPNLTITTYAGNGTAAYTGDGGPAASATLNFPCDVDCDAAGNLYIADRDNSVIRRVDAAAPHNITTFAGNGVPGYAGDGFAATDARLQRPCGLFVVRTGATAGRMYVADTYNSVVRVVWE